MSLAEDLAELRAALEAETDAWLAGEPHEVAAARKSLLVHALERRTHARATPELREDLVGLRAAAHRNAAVLRSCGEAARTLLADLAERIASVEDDGVYRRGELDGTGVNGAHSNGMAALPGPNTRTLSASAAVPTEDAGP